MAGRRVHVVMSAELVERIDGALVGGVSRGEFVRRAVEQALSEFGEAEATGVAIRPTSASPEPVTSAPAEQSRRLGSHAPTCKCPVCLPPKT